MTVYVELVSGVWFDTGGMDVGGVYGMPLYSKIDLMTASANSL